MKKIYVAVTMLVTTLWGASALASATCSGPMQDGNTWNLVCSDLSAPDTDTAAVSQCSYSVSITNKNGQENTVSASGTVEQGQSGVVIWSAIQFGGSDIVSATADGGCTLQ